MMEEKNTVLHMGYAFLPLVVCGLFTMVKYNLFQ